MKNGRGVAVSRERMNRTCLSSLVMLATAAALPVANASYITADLAGTWHTHSLATTSDVATQGWDNGVGWDFGSGAITEAGVFNGMIQEYLKSPRVKDGVQFSLNGKGEVQADKGGLNHGHLAVDKNTIMMVETLPGSAASAMRIFTRQGASYQTSDLAGTWQGHALASGPGAPWWQHCSLSMTADGQVTVATKQSNTTTDRPLPSQFVIDVADGVVTVAGASDPAADGFWHGHMAADKDMIVLVHTWDTAAAGTTELLVLTRQAATYQPSDLAGTWYMADFASNPGAPWWLWGSITIDKVGKFSGNLIDYDGESDHSAARFILDEAGVVRWEGRTTNPASPGYFNGHLSADKNTIVINSTWASGSPGTTQMSVLTRASGGPVVKETPVITWAPPAEIVYGTALSSDQLNATANVPGKFIYSPAAGVKPPEGTNTLEVTFTPTDTGRYNSVEQAVSLTVTPAAQPDSLSATVGTACEIPLPEAFAGVAKVTVKGLPAGLKYNTVTKQISGAPTKTGPFNIVFSAPGMTPLTMQITVASLPAWAQGTFNGYVEGGGLATMTVSAVGKVTGKIAMSGTNYTFSATSYALGGSAETGFAVEATAKAGKAALSLTLLVTHANQQALGVASGQFWGLQVSLYRSVWKDTGMAATADIYDGYFTATLPGNAEYGSGYLTFTVDKVGKVKTAGRMADGTAVSQTGALIMDATGGVFTVVYTAPTTYNGGSLFGLAEFVADADKVCLRPLDGAPFLWQSRNPQATGIYGDGFNRTPELVGGWYSKTGDLGVYYAGKDLIVGTETNAPLPELTVGSVRYDSMYWDPSGITLTPTLKSGVMTGLSAPAAGKPVDPEKDGVWDYGAANSVGLKIALTRATGIFKGSFLAWFDYPEKKHVSKSLSFEGVLTPVRENPDDGVAGRGFFLWADKSLSPAYSFNWSYDFKIMLSE